jgi:hypothetical protein
MIGPELGYAGEAALSVTDICRELIDLQNQRRFCIKSQSRCDRSMEAYIARLVGDHGGLSKPERKAFHALAKRMRLSIEKSIMAAEKLDPLGAAKWTPPEGAEPIVQKVSNLVNRSRTARLGWDEFRLETEERMRILARQLPVWPWVKGVKGFAELGLAVIVGETGNFSEDLPHAEGYANPAKVWKRLGLAVMDGRRQGSPGDGATKDDWIRHGYNPSRRAEVWALCSDAMFRNVWRGDKDEDGKNPKKTGKPVAIPAHPISPYGEAYGERKEWDLARGWTPGHADNDARRYMTKRLVRDLWRAWRDASAVVSSDGLLHPADLSEASQEAA